jgi:hypothetical protein
MLQAPNKYLTLILKNVFTRGNQGPLKNSRYFRIFRIRALRARKFLPFFFGMFRMFWAHFRAKAAALARKPGYPLVSFSPAAKKDTASIPCAEEEERTRAATEDTEFHGGKPYGWITKNSVASP